MSGIRRRVVEADAAQVARGEPAAHLGPGLAGVGAVPQAALRAAVDHPEVAPLAAGAWRRTGGRDLRIHHHVGAAGVLADLDEALRPGLAAVGGLVEAALAAALPQRTGRRHVDHVGIARVDHDAGDVLGRSSAPRCARCVRRLRSCRRRRRRRRCAGCCSRRCRPRRSRDSSGRWRCSRWSTIRSCRTPASRWCRCCRSERCCRRPRPPGNGWKNRERRRSARRVRR